MPSSIFSSSPTQESLKPVESLFSNIPDKKEPVESSMPPSITSLIQEKEEFETIYTSGVPTQQKEVKDEPSKGILDSLTKYLTSREDEDEQKIEIPEEVQEAEINEEVMEEVKELAEEEKEETEEAKEETLDDSKCDDKKDSDNDEILGESDYEVDRYGVG
jgi:hypothetical protein